MSDTDVLDPVDTTRDARRAHRDLFFTNGPVVVRDGQEIFLSAKEFALLQYLAAHPGRVVPRAELLAHLYPDQPVASANIIEVMVMRLRRKLSPHGEPDLVVTHRGVGYQFPTDTPPAGVSPPHISLGAGKRRAVQRWHRRFDH
jgi:DNA-binding response OmpR family regulator